MYNSRKLPVFFPACATGSELPFDTNTTKRILKLVWQIEYSTLKEYESCELEAEEARETFSSVE